MRPWGKGDGRPSRIRPAREVALVSLRCPAPLAQLAEQQTLNLRVRGSSPWRRTRSDLGFLRVFDPNSRGVSDRFVPLVAPWLLFGSVLVAIKPCRGPVR